MITSRPRFITGDRRRRRALTLLEIVLAMGILVAVSSMTYWFYASALSTGEASTEAAYRLRLARVVLDRMSREIRQAAAIQADGQVGIEGAPEAIRISSYRVPSRAQSIERPDRAAPRPAEYDMTRVEYKIARHPDIVDDDGFELALGLARVGIPVPRALPVLPRNAPVDRASQDGEDPFADEAAFPDDEAAEADGAFSDFSDVEQSDQSANLGPDINWEELYAPEIRYLRFCYYDGNKWWDSWEITGESPLPQLVQITVGFEGHPAFGKETGIHVVNDEFCTCQNEDPVECVPLEEGQFSTVVRVPQADPLFRSRVTRETQALTDLLHEGEEEEETPTEP